VYIINRLGNWQGVGGDRDYQFAPDGAEAVRARERLGLPISTRGIVQVVCEEIVNRAASESWPAELNRDADLPNISCGQSRQSVGRECEFAALVEAGILRAAGPVKVEPQTISPDPWQTVGLRFELTCTPLELVSWRRAYSAEQHVRQLKVLLASAQERIDELEAQSEEDSDD